MNSIVIGASGGIGAALAARLETRGETVHRLSRSLNGFDLTDEASIADAAAALPFDRIDRLIVATGLLHDGDLRPERALRDLTQDHLMRSFLVNAIGPALVLRHFVPLLSRDEGAKVALLSARVGSIADNRLGGWYGYRASKAALNQFVRTAAIEIMRTRPTAVVVALHPGTVDTAMSRPFQGNVAAERLFDSATSAERLIEVLDGLTPADSGGFFDWKGERVAF
ncbi:SDR family oxidoreductase [Sphingomonas rosea]|uniref:SDR family oxidoreductase n=1 Tax=Sphingomonas rosea TaxID=335605 RepID=A0ABP7TL89_9SPHN